MSQANTTVFLSSTSKDLAVFRQAAEEAILQSEMRPIMMERFPAASRDAVDVCEARVIESDLLVGIYAKRYGYCPNDGDYSITEMEYLWAEENGIDRLIFIFDEQGATLPADDPIYQHADHNPKMVTFLNYVGKQVVWKTFTSPDDLKHAVYVALQEWKERPARQKWFRSVRDMPRWARGVSLLLFITMLGILGYGLSLLLRAGQQTIGATLGIVSLLATITPIILFFWKRTQPFIADIPGIDRLRPWGLMLLFQIVVLGSLIGIFGFGTGIIANDLVTNAFATDNLNRAYTSLDSANVLGADIVEAIDDELDRAIVAPNTIADSDRAIFMARLYAHYADEHQRQQLAEDLSTRTSVAIDNGLTDQAIRLSQLTAILDRDVGATLASDLYNNSLNSLASTSPDTSRTSINLQSFIALDSLIDVGLSEQERSLAYYNRGLLLEETGQQEAAFEAYQGALTIDETNLEARYALASGLLVSVENGGDPSVLTTAIQIAENGYKDYIPNEQCRSSEHDLQDSAIFRDVWYCFLLMTTEGGARVLRDNPEDVQNTVQGVLERAINLADANDHFGDLFYTAEAYYWLALTSTPDPKTDAGKAIYCEIIQHHDSSNPRHRQWVSFANDALAGEFCF
jgi:tetratricopeptide (TPR) repeat protein